MAVEPDIIAGTITLTNGEDVFTGVGTSWLLSGGRAGDMIIDLPGTPYQGVVKEITSDTSGVLTKPWDGPTLTSAYRYRFQPDGSRVPAEARNLIELLGNGNLQAAAGLTGSANQVIMFTGPGAMTTISKAELTSGANYDVQVDTLADRNGYDGQAEGFAVLISDMGDGRSAITSRVTATTGVWSDPAYVTGPIGETPEVTTGPTTTLPPGSPATVTPTPTPGGVQLDFGIPAGKGFAFVPGGYNPATAYVKGDVIRDNGSSWIALQSTTGNAPPVYPVTSNAYWELLAVKGQDGEIDGVTPFWQTRILNDADAAAARAGLDLIKQASQTDATAGRLLTVGAFGAGKTVTLAAPNLNDTRPSGRYYCTSPTNGPGGNCWLDVWDLDADYSYQEVTDLAGKKWTRLRYAGVWTAWRLDTIESGSNANGFYMVFGDGTKIAWGNSQRTGEAINAPMAGLYRSTGLSVVLPISFTSGRLFMTPGSENALGIIGAAQSSGVGGGFAYVALAGASITASFSINWFVVGK